MKNSTKRLLRGFNFQSESNIQNKQIKKLNANKNKEIKGDK